MNKKRVHELHELLAWKRGMGIRSPRMEFRAPARKGSAGLLTGGLNCRAGARQTSPGRSPELHVAECCPPVHISALRRAPVHEAAEGRPAVHISALRRAPVHKLLPFSPAYLCDLCDPCETPCSSFTCEFAFSFNPPKEAT